jgi:hypothetical protein
MKLYNVFIKQDSVGNIEDVRLLKDGISILALLFTPLWFLYHKMYKEFAAVIILSIILSTATQSASDLEAALLQGTIFLIIAINANYWLGEHLRKNREYYFAGMIFSKSPIEAKLNFTRNFGVEFSDLNPKAIS